MMFVEVADAKGRHTIQMVLVVSRPIAFASGSRQRSCNMEQICSFG